MSENENNNATTIEDFVSPQKVVAFCNAYIPSDVERPEGDTFNEARLRRYFEAYPRSVGDPLVYYLDALQRNGFFMKTSVTGEPAIFVGYKASPHEHALTDCFFGGWEED